MTGGLIRVCCVAGAALGTAGFACEGQSATTVLQVALRSRVPAAAGVEFLPGDTIGVVRLDPAAPATVVSMSASQLLAPFRAALAGAARPATSPVVTLPLPQPPSPTLGGVPLDIVLFGDTNGDRAWQAGEPYATAWSGGRGGYRLMVEAPPAPDGLRWRLVEGGDPPPDRLDPAGTVVYIDPVRPAIER